MYCLCIHMNLFILLILIPAVYGCSDTTYAECVSTPSCLQALWQPTKFQFDRFVFHLPLNCSSPSPALDLAARVRTKYSCPAGLYGSVDGNGMLLCQCPSGQTCDVPDNQSLILGLLFAILVIVIIALLGKSNPLFRKDSRKT